MWNDRLIAFCILVCLLQTLNETSSEITEDRAEIDAVVNGFGNNREKRNADPCWGGGGGNQQQRRNPASGGGGASPPSTAAAPSGGGEAEDLAVRKRRDTYDPDKVIPPGMLDENQNIFENVVKKVVETYKRISTWVSNMADEMKSQTENV